MDGPVYEKMMASEEFVEEDAPAALDDADQIDQVDAGMQSDSSDDDGEFCSNFFVVVMQNSILSFFKSL